MYRRLLDIKELVKHRSLFLFGPRQTGKSTLLRFVFPEAKFFDLLEADTFRELAARPELIRQTLSPADRIIVIDEIQKLPSLLDEVHLLIERNKELRFIMTGSSARKLKRGAANLLAGRAWVCRLHPLVSAELGFDRLTERLNRGGLPAVIDSEFYREDLSAYVGTYLQEEIQAEGLSRSIEGFSRFLEVAGLTNAEQVNFTAVASDAGLPPRVVRQHYDILQDTLIGYLLPAYQKTIKRKPVSRAKFFFFDIGVANVLLRRGEIVPGSESFGRALEHLIFLELRAFLDYRRREEPLAYWRSRSQLEVDFTIGDEVGIEVKSKPRVATRDYRGLIALGEELRPLRKIVIATEARRRKTDEGVEVFPVRDFLRDLWKGKIVGG